MLEILILYNMSRDIAARARAKGYSPHLFVLGLIVLWFGSEFSGGVLGAILFPGTLVASYVLGLGSACLGAFVVFRVVDNFPSRLEQPTHNRSKQELPE